MLRKFTKIDIDGTTEEWWVDDRHVVSIAPGPRRETAPAGVTGSTSYVTTAHETVQVVGPAETTARELNGYYDED